MLDGLKPYPAYKESGVPWLGRIPEGWTVARNGRLFSRRNESGTADLPILEVSLRTGVRVRTFADGGRKQVMADLAGYRRAVQGDIAYNTMRMWQGAVGVVPVNGLVSPAYVVACPQVRTNSAYFSHLYRSPAYLEVIDGYSRGIVKDRNRLYWEDYKAISSPVPPLEEQAAIARFIDYADHRFRLWIRFRQLLIKFLGERKQAVIHRVVVRGVDSGVRLKPSGVDWLGDVPDHWEVKRLKWVTRLQRGFDLPGDSRESGPYPVISSGGVIGTHSEARVVGPGVVMGRYGSTDALFFIGSDFWPHNTALFVSDFQGSLPRWCYFLLQTISKADYSGKSAVPGIDRKDLYEIPVVCPPLQEQELAAAAIDQTLAMVESGVSAIHREMALLRELRTRLIADLVTGKLDVREAAANLPEETIAPDTTEYDELEGPAEDDTNDAPDTVSSEV